ncbi:hypothetical protein COB52_04005 [Candidatus Kaiserbacteria bacterium]|nr:MAG: hypothetical protein COB52_04005 [Candidatus Kaiserbacteria bacterium]
MRNWWQSIRERVVQIKGNTPKMGQDVFIVLVLMLVGLGAFGLGRLSMMEEQRPAIRMFEQTMKNVDPISMGGLVVASRNGSKYHFPWCSGAQRMSEVNKVWFKSIDEAKKAGFTAAGNCKGLK